MKVFEIIGGSLIKMSETAGGLSLLFVETLYHLKDISFKDTFKQMALLGADSLPIVAATILCTGMVFSVQTAKEFVELGASSTVGGIVAVSMARELVPILTGVVVAGRIGAAIAAEIGTMKVTEQVDALRVMAANPISYLVVPRFVAIICMMPILVVFGNLIGDIGGWGVAHYYAGISTFSFTNSIKTFAEFYDVLGGMLKSCVFGGIIAIVGCYKGLNAPNGAEGVGLATTASVVLSIILIFVTNYFLSILIYV
ncbi:MAG: ABC transporter permease [Phascolarctobacterium sp.]|nr:ABC transporter permease [Candidatus Phascolarctobacterium caballi]